MAKPDENLVSNLDRGLVTDGRSLDLGRNARCLASRGFEVDAVDLSPAADAGGRERAQETAADVRCVCGDDFSL